MPLYIMHLICRYYMLLTETSFLCELLLYLEFLSVKSFLENVPFFLFCFWSTSCAQINDIAINHPYYDITTQGKELSAG